jgi:hypothetical protein
MFRWGVIIFMIFKNTPTVLIFPFHPSSFSLPPSLQKSQQRSSGNALLSLKVNKLEAVG